MKLKQLKIHPRGELGWGSLPLVFGEDITQLYGPNGCGKTPVIHSIAHALGYPVKYREDIIENCFSTELIVEHDGREVLLTRELSRDFKVVVFDKGNNSEKIFYNEKDLSQELFGKLGLDFPVITNNKNESASPYISTFLPLFYVDQDSGYTSPYSPQASFLKDQYSEMIRIALGIPPKNSYERRRLVFQKQEQLKRVDIEIVQKEKQVARLRDRAESSKTADEIRYEIEKCRNDLEQLRVSQDASKGIDSAYSDLIQEKLDEKKQVDNRVNELQTRISSFIKIKEEIEVEINTLSLNEEARRLFSSFKDICASEHCQLFLSSSESYGKNLLYLRDQIKDLDRNTSNQKIRVEELYARSSDIQNEINKIRKDILSDQGESTTDRLVNLTSSLTRTIIDLQTDLEILEAIDEEEKEYVQLLNQREVLQNDISSIDTGSGQADLRILQFRTDFKSAIIKWLDILSTKNVSRDISIDSDFNLLFGNEKLSQFSGSTLLRVVLAVKAAFFDIYTSLEKPSVQFMIFDTPRQHDIESEHLAFFIQNLKNLVTGTDYQIIFSTTDYHYDIQERDIEWIPLFSGFEQEMFLGTLDA